MSTCKYCGHRQGNCLKRVPGHRGPYGLVCTREPGHPGLCVACNMTEHDMTNVYSGYFFHLLKEMEHGQGSAGQN